MTVASTTSNDHAYNTLLQRLQDRFTQAVATGEPLFTTDVTDLYALFLAAFPEADRQQYNCHACCAFVNTFGGLVTINAEGVGQSALWNEDDAPGLYQAPVRAMFRAVQKAAVNGVFYSSVPVWGRPVTGVWHHLAVTPPPSQLFSRLTQTAAQARAEKREDYHTLSRALADFTPEMLRTALTLLKTESLYRSEKVQGVATWLLTLHQRRAAAKGIQRDNVIWRAVATAPAGFCHPRSSMIGTLLEDIAAGLPFETISQRFAAKMHPLRYLRPQAAPTAGNIAQAEKLIAQLQAAHALARRYATLDDIQTIWKPIPKPPSQQRSGVFGHLQPKRAQPNAQTLTPPAVTITWEKFQRTVLPTAQTIDFFVPHENDDYTALVTAVDPAAPLIFQWDNPVNLYVYHGGSPATSWGLVAGRLHAVTAVTLRPSMWSDPNKLAHQGAGVIFILEGAQDKRTQSAGLALFPETLRAEFHSIRATIEAFSRAGTIADAASASACGIILSKGGQWKARFRVVATDGMIAEYHLDRWD